jgi:hypothetical protein
MAFTVATASVVMTERIESVLRSGLIGAQQIEANTFNMFMQGERERTNELGRRIPFTVTPNASYGSIAEAGQLPLAGTPQIVQARIYYLNQFKTGEINKAVLDQETESDLMKFMRTPMEMDFDDFRSTQNLWMFGTGDGALGVIATGGIASLVITLGGDYGAENIKKGARLQFYTSGGVQRTGGSVTVSTVASVSGNAVTFDAVPNDLAATDTLHYENSYGNAPHGIPYHVSETSGTWLTINTGTYSGLKSTILDAGATLGSGGTAMTPGMIDLVQAKARKRGGTANSPKRVIISHLTQEYNYRQLGYTTTYGVQRILGANAKIDLAIGEASHNGMAWKVDLNCARSDMWLLNLPDWKIEYTRLPSFYDESGDNTRKLWQKSGSGAPYDVLQYAVHGRYDLLCVDRRNQAGIRNLPYVAGL